MHVVDRVCVVYRCVSGGGAGGAELQVVEHIIRLTHVLKALVCQLVESKAL